MRSLQARRLLKKHCRHYEKWLCGQATIYLSGRDQEPRFDRRMEIFLNQPPEMVDVKKISRLLRFLDRLGRRRGWL